MKSVYENNFFKDFIYLFMRETHTHTEAEGEAGSMQGADVGLDYGSPGSCPGLSKPLSHSGCPRIQIFNNVYY